MRLEWVFSLVLLGSGTAAWADSTACSDQNVEVEETIATADVWANLWRREGSIRAESERMLTRAGSAKEADAIRNACEGPCRPGETLVVFSVTPLRVLEEYAHRERCAEKFAQTSTKPFVRMKTFRDTAELSSWFSDFSQGRGADGEELYERCAGGCSPRYKTYITSHEGGLEVRAEVACGHRRDRDDNRYRLEISSLIRCNPDASAKPAN